MTRPVQQLFSKPPAPTVVQVPAPPTPDNQDPALQEAAAKERLKARGRASTVLTSGAGLSDPTNPNGAGGTPAKVSRRTLMGF